MGCAHEGVAEALVARAISAFELTAFREDAVDRKRHTNVPAFGSSKSTPNPYLWLPQEELKVACPKRWKLTGTHTLLSIQDWMTGLILRARKGAVFLQTWEDDETHREEKVLGADVQVMAPIHDGMIIKSSHFSTCELLPRLNTVCHVRWSLSPFKTACRWELCCDGVSEAVGGATF